MILRSLVSLRRDLAMGRARFVWSTLLDEAGQGRTTLLHLFLLLAFDFDMTR
jgi:hypothetical protein